MALQAPEFDYVDRRVKFRAPDSMHVILETGDLCHFDGTNNLADKDRNPRLRM